MNQRMIDGLQNYNKKSIIWQNYASGSFVIPIHLVHVLLSLQPFVKICLNQEGTLRLGRKEGTLMRH